MGKWTEISTNMYWINQNNHYDYCEVKINKSSNKCNIQVKIISLELTETRGPPSPCLFSLSKYKLPNNSYSKIHSTRIGSFNLSPYVLILFIDYKLVLSTTYISQAPTTESLDAIPKLQAHPQLCHLGHQTFYLGKALFLNPHLSQIALENLEGLPKHIT